MRNADKTRRKILAAAGRILTEEGYDRLGVNRIAAAAAIGKPLIYRYFGDLDGLVAVLAEGAAADLQAPRGPRSIHAAPATEVLAALLGYGRKLASNGAARGLLLRQLARGDVPGLAAVAEGTLGEPNQGADKADRAAIHAILRAAIVFLVICRDRHPSWDGLPIVSPKDMVRFEAALAWIVDQAWAAEPASVLPDSGEMP